MSRAPLQPRSAPDLRLRRRLLMLGLAVAFGILTAGVFYRQVIQNEFLQREGEARYLRDAVIPARRGIITDRNGEPLAVSTPVETVWCDPRRLVNQPDRIILLARTLDLDPAFLRDRIEANRDKGFLYVKRRISLDEAQALRSVIAKHRIEGIDFENEYRRFYPGAEVFAHVIGYTNIEDRGQEGIELAYDRILKAEPGLKRVIQDGRRRAVQEVEQVRPARPGHDLALTLDRRLQYLAYRELKAAVTEHRAKGGSLVVLDVASGEVLAMVNQPSFNPNSERNSNPERRRNRTLTDLMEPGSTLKPFVVAAALETGVITPASHFSTEPYTVAGNVVRDVHNYGTLDVTGIITKSSNVGAVKIAQKMSYETLWRLYDRLGFGHTTGIGFPGESPGRLRHYSTWRPFEHATHAFGYGLSVTPMQLAQAYLVLAADGVKRPLTLLKRDPSMRPESPSGVRILSRETAQRLRAMMETVVSEQGTAKLAMIPGYRAAGKTGTAKKSAGHAGYASNRYQSVFAGFVPAHQPHFVMVVMIDEPSAGEYYGGVVAAPIFQRVMEGALRLFNVPPDNPAPSMLLAAQHNQGVKP
ncbi:penicillin-binding protein 2 [Caldichromatium japonicum]|uniref:Peptidoglycan D,D-transpeptidase FtsI n=2 Tax=Caldichromatium japonicum TaxID=2699430 RepID=A0A6G7VH48_9GAMM|nr:penicillin-binding protein 2 [Caldichromatium japonicum]